MHIFEYEVLQSQVLLKWVLQERFVLFFGIARSRPEEFLTRAILGKFKRGGGRHSGKMDGGIWGLHCWSGKKKKKKKRTKSRKEKNKHRKKKKTAGMDSVRAMKERHLV